MRKLRNNNDATGMTMIFYIVFFIMIISAVYFLLGGLSSDNVEVYENGTLNSFTPSESNTRLVIYVEGIGYKQTFNRMWEGRDYVDWLFNYIGYEVSFFTYEDGIVDDDGNKYCYSLYVHAFKNVTVKQVLYEEDGWGWWDKPPVRVVFNDGSNFIFRGDSDYKFDMYSMFIAYNGEQVHIDYKFDEDETIVLSIERVGCPDCEEE